MRSSNRGRKRALGLAPRCGLIAVLALSPGTPVGATVDGGGPKRSDCYVELDGVNAKGTRLDCTDGDPTCDRDGKCDGTCTFRLRLCVNQTDIVPQCSSPGLSGPPTVTGATLPAPTDLTHPSCAGSFTTVTVATKPAKGRRKPRPGTLTIRTSAKAISGRPKVDRDTLRLRCKPRKENTCPEQCSCPGGDPKTLSFTTVVGSGACGHLDADSAPNFLPLACAGLYFGGSAVAVPLPSKVPDMGMSIATASCVGTTLTLASTDAASTGGNRCSGGTKHLQACTTDADCPGGACTRLHCTKKDCLFGAPLPIPNTHHNFAPASTCVINTIARDATGEANCSDGTVTPLDLPLGSVLHLVGDGLPNRCFGGSTAGAGCTPVGSPCPGGGTCVNDTGRCKGGSNARGACNADGDCPGGTCETAACAGGTNDGEGCVTDADCPSPGVCKTFIQPCPICNATTNVCNGGPNDGLACVPSDTAIDGDFPTSHDCPPPPTTNIGTLSIGFVLTTGTVTKTAVDLPSQKNVFCGYCRNPTAFAQPAVACTADADCAAVTGFTSCAQHTAGAFTQTNVARTITETGTPAGPVTTNGPAKSATLVSVFCIPPSFSPLVDAAADLAGPGAVALPGNMQFLP